MMPSRSIYAAWYLIQIGPRSLHVFQLDNGDYCLDRLETVAAVHLDEDSLDNFLDSDRFWNMPDLGARAFLLPKTLKLEGFERPIQPILLETALLYWQHCAGQGCYVAQILTLALLRQTLWQAIVTSHPCHTTALNGQTTAAMF